MPYWGTCTNEKMYVIKHGLEFSQLSPSKDAHLGNDFLEPSVDGAILWIVGDNRSAVLGTLYKCVQQLGRHSHKEVEMT